MRGRLPHRPRRPRHPLLLNQHCCRHRRRFSDWLYCARIALRGWVVDVDRGPSPATAEIAEHCRRIGRHLDLYDDAVFSTEVTDLEWDEHTCRWTIRTNRGDEMRPAASRSAPDLCIAPSSPVSPGSSRSPDTASTRVAGTTTTPVATRPGLPWRVWPTSASDHRDGRHRVQCIPHLARAAGELLVFQRTPSSIDVRNNHDIDPEWFDTLEPG
jgi:hypothetical protein